MESNKANVAYRLGERLGAEERQDELDRIRDLARDIQVNVEDVSRAFKPLGEGKGEQSVEKAVRLRAVAQEFKNKLGNLQIHFLIPYRGSI